MDSGQAAPVEEEAAAAGPADSGQAAPVEEAALDEEFELDQPFACESSLGKRKFIDLNANSERRRLGERLVRIFCDIKDICDRQDGLPCPSEEGAHSKNYVAQRG